MMVMIRYVTYLQLQAIKILTRVGFDPITICPPTQHAEIVQNGVFWVVTPCSLIGG
jgi:hypothetical protein